MDFPVRPLSVERRSGEEGICEGGRTGPRTDLEVHPTAEVVATGELAESRTRLSLSECQALLAELERRYGDSAVLRIDVSWRFVPNT